MDRISEPQAFQRRCEELRLQLGGSGAAGHALGFVPTMGALHAGHLSLVAEAKRHARCVALSIFVNPTQFGPGEDLDRYPRDMAGDLELCRRAGVDLVFTPEAPSMYPPGDETRVRTRTLAQGLCGRSRPEHFEGVCTVVAKLFALAGPCVAVFGRKDYQQLKIIERMAQDLWFPVKIVGAPIFRELDGLAMSSRNRYLSAEERARALSLCRGLRAARDAFRSGERSAERLRAQCEEALLAASARIDYVEIVDARNLAPFTDQVPAQGVMLAVAAFVGKTRLIDNTQLDGDEALGGEQ